VFKKVISHSTQSQAEDGKRKRESLTDVENWRMWLNSGTKNVNFFLSFGLAFLTFILKMSREDHE
jgi:hypothetical protein